ncbi:MAG: type II toxin-antitoxin system RelE/ParE family toxin [Thiolinea sp.]
MNVIFSPESENDLEAIADYIAEDNPAKALNFVQELKEHCENLSNFPHRNPVYGEIDDVTVRKYSYKNYIIYYGVGDDILYIFHIWHAARRQPDFS